MSSLEQIEYIPTQFHKKVHSHVCSFFLDGLLWYSSSHLSLVDVSMYVLQVSVTRCLTNHLHMFFPSIKRHINQKDATSTRYKMGLKVFLNLHSSLEHFMCHDHLVSPLDQSRPAAQQIILRCAIVGKTCKTSVLPGF